MGLAQVPRSPTNDRTASVGDGTTATPTCMKQTWSSCTLHSWPSAGFSLTSAEHSRRTCAKANCTPNQTNPQRVSSRAMTPQQVHGGPVVEGTAGTQPAKHTRKSYEHHTHSCCSQPWPAITTCAQPAERSAWNKAQVVLYSHALYHVATPSATLGSFPRRSRLCPAATSSTSNSIGADCVSLPEQGRSQPSAQLD
jgi:hypothetical protein